MSTKIERDAEVQPFLRNVTIGIHRTMWVSHTDFTEMALGWMALIWGVWVLGLNGALDSGFFLALPFPAWFVGLVFTSVGVAQIVATARFHFIARRVTTLLMMFLWAAVAGNAFVANPASVLVPFYAHLAALALWLHVRVRYRGRSF